LYGCFGDDTAIVNIPALRGELFGGLTTKQVYDMNRLADGVVIGGGNLIENGQLTVDSRALHALRAPMLLIGLSHRGIYDADYSLINRTDSLPRETVLQLVEKASVTLLRDHASMALLEEMGINGAEVGGCPSLFLSPNGVDHATNGRILISVRHPANMS